MCKVPIGTMDDVVLGVGRLTGGGRKCDELKEVDGWTVRNEG
jgi:hypothetical protein